MEDLKKAEAEAFLGKIIKSGGCKYSVTQIIETKGKLVRVRVEEIGKNWGTSITARSSDGSLGYTFYEPEQPKEPIYSIY